MKIKNFETLHADATGQGFQSVSFLKIETDTNIVGWSEFVGFELNKRMGLDSLIQSMMRSLIGKDPREIEKINADLITGIRQSQGGLNHQAIGAIQNCLVDITAKDLAGAATDFELIFNISFLNIPPPVKIKNSIQELKKYCLKIILK